MKINGKIEERIWFSCQEKNVAEKKGNSYIGEKDVITIIEFDSFEEIENTIQLLRELEGIVVERDLFHKAPDNDIPTEDALPDSPIDVARMLIYAEYEYNNPEFVKKIFSLPDKSTSCKYSVSELREIANHLLVFCDGHKEDETSR